MPDKTAPLSYRIPAELKEGLQKLADADRRKRGPYIQLVLEAHVEAKKQEGKRPKTRS
jgi:predicted DNA-binding protein